MRAPFCFRQKPLSALISAVCLQWVGAQAFAASCPAAVSNVITVSGVTVDSTCTIGAGNQLQVDNTGTIDVANQNGNAVLVDTSVAATSITNAGTISSPYSGGTPNGDAIHLNSGASLANGISNSGTVTANSNAISLDGATVNGGITNTVSGQITAPSGAQGIVLTNNAVLSGGIDNAGTIIGLRGITVVGSTINDGLHNRVGAQLGDPNNFGYGLRAESSSSFNGNILNEGSIDGGEGAVSFLTASSMTGNITNSGDISGGVAIQFSGTSQLQGNISNSSTIHGSDAGIEFDSSSMTGAITNTGTITTLFGGAIYFHNGAALTGNIDNQNGGLIDGGESAGIDFLGGSTLTGSILNEGTITAGLINSVAAIVIDSSSLSGAINNSGTIHDTSNGYAIKINDGASVGSLVNSGTIAAQNSDAIYINGSTVGSGINNSGTITGNNGSGINLLGATISSSGITNQTAGTISGTSFSVNIASNSVVTGNFLNQGVINGISSTGGGAQISDSTLTGNITNSGTISSYQLINSATLFITNATVTGAINNSGTVTNSSTGEAILINSDSHIGALMNSGTVNTNNLNNTGNNIAVDINGSAVAQGISNSGTIAGGSGIVLNNSAVITANGISNTGHITASSQAIAITGSSVTGDISNAANAALTGTAQGLAIFGSTLHGNIDNSGTIDGLVALWINNSSVSGDIVNHAGGSITDAISGYALLISNAGTVANITNSGTISGTNGIGLLSGTVSGAITNNAGGTITASSGVGIRLTSDATAGAIFNAGIITAPTGIEVDSGSTVTGGISNSGTVASNTGIGIKISGANFAGDVTNSGTISGMSAIDLTGATAAIAVNNTGLLDGAVLLGAQTLNLNGNSSRVTGAILGEGSTVNVNGVFTPENTIAVDTFTIASSGTLNATGAITVSNAVQTFGTLSVKAAQPFTVAGNYVQSADGVFRMDAISPTQYGKMNVTGSATLAPLTHIFVDVAQGATLIPNGVLPGVITAGSLSASTFTVADNSILFDFVGIVNGNAVDLNVQRGLSVYDSVVENNNFPGAGAAKTFDNLIQQGSATGDMATVVSALATLSSTKEVSDAVQQTLPVLTGGTNTALVGTLDSVNRIVQARQEANLGLSSGEGFLTDRAFWLKPFGSWSSQSSRQGVAGYDANGGGLAAGIDGAISERERLGFAFAYARTSLDSKGETNQSADIDSYQAIVYGSYELAPRTDINYQIDFGHNKTDADRTIDFANLQRKASANFSGNSFQVGAGIGHVFSLNDATTLTPSTRIDYTALKNNSYTESGADALDLHVDEQTTDQLVIGVDAKLNYLFKPNLTLTANIGEGYDTYHKTNSITATFTGGGPAFVTEGLESSPWLTRGGLGLTYKQNNMEFSGRYDAEVRPSAFHNQTVSLKFRMLF